MLYCFENSTQTALKGAVELMSVWLALGQTYTVHIEEQSINFNVINRHRE